MTGAYGKGKSHLTLAFLALISGRELKCFLGEKTYNSLVEWRGENQLPFTKQQLSSMILTIHGLKILKQQSFRLKLVERFTAEELNRFEELYSQHFADKQKLCEKIASSPWKSNPVSLLLASVLEIPNTIFDKPEKVVESVTSISTYDTNLFLI